MGLPLGAHLRRTCNTSAKYSRTTGRGPSVSQHISETDEQRFGATSRHNGKRARKALITVGTAEYMQIPQLMMTGGV